MVDPKGKVWVLDFGLVKVSEAKRKLEFTGNLIGTPRYIWLLNNSGAIVTQEATFMVLA